MRKLAYLAALAAATTLGTAHAQNAPTFASYGFDPNTQNTGAALDAYTGTAVGAGARATALANSVNAQTTPGATNAQLLAISPSAFQLLPQLSLESANWQDTIVRQYQRDVRQGGTESPQRATLFGSDRHAGMWLQAGGRTGYFRADTDRYRTSYDASSVIGGLDVRLARGTLVGIYGGYDMGTANLTPNVQKSDIDTWFAGGYASATVGPVYVDVHGFYGRTDDIARRAVLDGFGGSLQSSTRNGINPHSINFGGTATGGLSFDARGFELEPYVGAKYTQIRLRSFNEGLGFGLYDVNGITTNSLESIAGLRIGAKVPLTATAAIRPSVHGEYRHEFDNADRGRDLAVNFEDGVGGGTPFLYRTQPLPRDYAAVGAGFTISGDSPLSFNVDYNGEVGGQRRIHGITGGVHLAF